MDVLVEFLTREIDIGYNYIVWIRSCHSCRLFSFHINYLFPNYFIQDGFKTQSSRTPPKYRYMSGHIAVHPNTPKRYPECIRQVRSRKTQLDLDCASHAVLVPTKLRPLGLESVQPS